MDGNAELPHERLFPWPEEKGESNSDFVKRLDDFSLTFQKRLKERQEELKQKVDKKLKKARRFELGELVLVARDVRKKGKAKKFLPLYIEPYQIFNQIPPVTYLIEDVPARRKKKTRRRFPAHVSQLKPFQVPHDYEWDAGPQRTKARDPPSLARKRTRSGRQEKLPVVYDYFEIDSSPRSGKNADFRQENHGQERPSVIVLGRKKRREDEGHSERRKRRKNWTTGGRRAGVGEEGEKERKERHSGEK
jgi:hypothetical protein